MWRLGFLGWRVWVYARVLVPAAVVLWLVHRVHGTTAPFWITALFLAGILLGARFVLRDLARQELGTVGRQRAR